MFYSEGLFFNFTSYQRKLVYDFVCDFDTIYVFFKYLNLLYFFFFWRGGKIAKSFIDVVQDSPRTGLSIPVKTKIPPLSNQYTTRGTAFRL